MSLSALEAEDLIFFHNYYSIWLKGIQEGLEISVGVVFLVRVVVVQDAERQLTQMKARNTRIQGFFEQASHFCRRVAERSAAKCGENDRAELPCAEDI